PAPVDVLRRRADTARAGGEGQVHPDHPGGAQGVPPARRPAHRRGAELQHPLNRGAGPSVRHGRAAGHRAGGAERPAAGVCARAMSVGAGRLVDDDDGAGAPEGRAMQSWVTGPFLGFDTETTGVDPRTDRIVSAALVMRDARGTRQRTWLVDPGVEIPQPASAVHGITTDHVRAEGLPPHQALEEIAAELTRATAAGVPVVVYNACFDIRLLEHELTRWGLPT